MRRQKKDQESALRFLDVQVWHLDPKGSGIVVFQYGTPDYMVSGRFIEKMKKHLEPVLKERYPNYTFLFLPFYVRLEDIEKTERTKIIDNMEKKRGV
ncbi:hypothetical protein LCGC14_0617750 [marine sediment metagenome]|uniref:Uncharacterized protein n=1 Tax=marine sediment metagenome TaxID=412755 RepID=A0A0F9UEB1_9ZZZZ